MNGPHRLELTASTASTLRGSCDTHGPWTTPAILIAGRCINARAGCPTCERERAATEERAELDAALERRLDAAGVPLRARPRVAGAFDPPTADARANAARLAAYAGELAAGRAASMILLGRPGTGKTHLAGALAGQLLGRETPIGVRYTTATELVRHVRGAYQAGAGYTERDALERFVRPRLLILDELGAKGGTDHERSTLFEVVDQRYQRMLPTLAISNLSLGLLERAVDDRLVDRLRDGAEVLAFDWPSHRTLGARR